MRRWYVLHTKTCKEKRVASALQQRDIEAFLPVVSGNAEKRRQTRKALFPGYVFARFDLASGDPANWKWIPGLRYVVGYGGEPIAVPAEIIRVISRKVRELQEAEAQSTLPFKSGDVVRIKDGPFADMMGVFDKACKPGKRAQILLDALERSYKLKIELERLEKAPDSRAKEKRPRRTRGRGRRIRQ